MIIFVALLSCSFDNFFLWLLHPFVFSSERAWASAWKRGTVDLCRICRWRSHQYTNPRGLPWTSKYFGMQNIYWSVEYSIFCSDWTIWAFRLPVTLVPPRYTNCSREKFTAQLDGTLCLIAYLFTKRSLRNPFNLPQACCLIFQREMHRHLLRI